MLFFTNLTLKRGLTTLLENANATINPGQKVGLVGKNGCGKSSLFALLKNEMSAEGGEVSFPSTWALAWVNQETPALDCRAIDYVIQGVNTAVCNGRCNKRTRTTTVMRLPRCIINLMPLMLGRLKHAPANCCTVWAFLRRNWNSR